MADAVITKTGKVKMLQARAGDISLPPIEGMAFGSGGADSSGTVIVPSETQTALNNELTRKTIESHTFTSDTCCRYTCTLEENELAGSYISEIALYDTDGDLIAIKNFTPKGKDEGLEMIFNIDDVM